MSHMRLSDLLNVESMQVMQRGFSRVTGMAAAIIDENGVLLSRSDRRARFCFELTRSCAEGEKRCNECDRAGAKRAMRSGKPEVYTCHAGVCDIAAPIIVDGRFMGAFVGGQVIVEEPDEKQIRAIATELGLDPDDKKPVGKYSLGQRQRLGFAQAFMENPNVLILDEPFNAMDKASMEEVHDLLQKFKSQGKIIILASHSAADIQKACDVVYEMENGELTLASQKA